MGAKVFTDCYTVNGKLIGVPWDYSTIATVFIVDHVREAGLTLPAQLGDKWDWNTALEYAQKMTKKSNNPPRWGILSESTGETGWFNWIVANGAQFFDARRLELPADWPGRYRAQLGRELHPAIPHHQEDSQHRQPARPCRGAGVQGAPAGVGVHRLHAQEGRAGDHPIAVQEVPAGEDVALSLYADPAKAGPPQNRKALADAIKAVTPLPWHDTAPRAEWNPIIDRWRNDMWDNKVTVQEGLRQLQEELQKLIDQHKK